MVWVPGYSYRANRRIGIVPRSSTIRRGHILVIGGNEARPQYLQ